MQAELKALSAVFSAVLRAVSSSVSTAVSFFVISTAVSSAVSTAFSSSVSISAVHAGTPEQQQRQQQLERLLASAAKMLPMPQLGLATAPPHTPGPALSLGKASALGQVAMPSHLLHCICVHR